MSSRRQPRATIDFETRSACSLKDRGSWVYSEHPTTEVMCLAWRLPYWEPGRVELWHMAHDQHWIGESHAPQELFDWVAAGGLVEAHNAFFEQAIWLNVCVARKGWPVIPLRQWRCSAAKASAHSLPRDLERACLAMGLPIQKDMQGRQVMLKLTKPRKPRKKEKAEFTALYGDDPADWPILWNEDEADIVYNWKYNRGDVLAEEALSESLEDLSPLEQELWFMDQEINLRGVRIDRAMCKGALEVQAQTVARLNRELFELTGIEKGSQRAQVRDWLWANERVMLADTTGPVVDAALADPTLTGRAKRVLTILRQVNRTSTKKYTSMLDRASEKDDRVRDTMMFHGASTGRWSGKGIQPHNFPRGNIKKAKGTAKDVDVWETVAQAISSGDAEWVEFLYGDPTELLSYALRGAIIPEEGHDFVTLDFAAIEARVVLWMAGAISALEVFRRGEDVYCDFASTVYGRPITKDDTIERFFGKQAILGLGFGMGPPKFVATCAKFGERVELDFAKRVVDIYRKEKYPEVPELWKTLENGALQAMRSPGVVVKAGPVQWRRKKKFLQCKLPSGRLLSYADPAIIKKHTPWGTEQDVLSYMEVDAKTKQWVRTDTYGGKLCENVVQATARDFLALGMMAVHTHGLYKMVLSVHDENVAEVPKGKGSIEEFEQLMLTTAKWGDGCPIAVEGWRAGRYRK